jgi:type II secretory ATPase GspE/PulE/Tfp pilus assembly ATPase PilB-like protein
MLLTGPTGSGKSTTLYTALLSLDPAMYNIRTVEDPIEYQLPKIIQTQVDRSNDVTTARALRSILRADPDVILVGEIRDEETARLAIDASNTGHLVLSTLHTNDAITIVPRLMALGLDRHEIQENVTLGIAQRLVQVICPSCKATQEPSQLIKRHLQYYHLPVPEHVCESTGCARCRGTGVVSRLPIFQFIHNQGEITRAIGRGADSVELGELNAPLFNPLIVDALYAVIRGDTSYAMVHYLESGIVPSSLAEGQVSPHPLAPQ